MAYLVQLTQPHQVELHEYRTPEPGPGEVRVRTLYSGISAGTELATYRGTNPYLQKQWDPAVGLFLPGQTTFSYPVDVSIWTRARSRYGTFICRQSACRIWSSVT